MLRVRAAMLRAAREFFQRQDYLEVETPCLSRDIVIDAWLEPMEVQHSGKRWFLQTSPEASMKRLLAAGCGSIFQISRVFRADESGPRHNPEFTMIEWYGVETDWQQQVVLTEQLVRCCVAAASEITGYNLAAVWSVKPFDCTTYAQAFQRVFQIDVHSASGGELLAVAKKSKVPIPESCTPEQRDDLLNAMLAFAIEPDLGRCKTSGQSAPEFLCDYPPSQAALAQTSGTHPKVARRFELYIDGIELCNGYQELTDVVELQRREDFQNAVRNGSDLKTLPGAPAMAAAMKSGLPNCSGVALGFDRLVMIATGAMSLSEVLAFPADRA
jgi:lysyl-tRNA synthetase class 2